MEDHIENAAIDWCEDYASHIRFDSKVLTWFSDLCFLFESNVQHQEVYKAVLRRIFVKHHLAKHRNKTLGVREDTLLTRSAWKYPVMFTALMNLAKEFQLEINRIGDGKLPIYWIISFLSSHPLAMTTVHGLTQACIQCLDATSDSALHTDCLKNSSISTLGTLLSILAQHIDSLTNEDEKRLILSFYLKMTERIHEDQSAIVFDGLFLPEDDTRFCFQLLYQKQQKQIYYFNNIQTTLVNVLSSHMLSHCIPLLKIILSYSWIFVT